MSKAKMLMTMAVVLCLAVTVFAAKPGEPRLGEGKGKVILSWDEFVKITNYGKDKKDPQMLTIPWKQVQDLLGVELKGMKGMGNTMVNLPWKDFKALLEWSVRKAKPEPDAPPPPTDYIITSSQYIGTLTADGASFTRKVKLDVLRKKGWKRIPILPTGVAVTKTTLPKEVYLNSAGGVYELLTEKSGAMEIVLEFSVAVHKSSGVNRVSFPSTPLCSSVLDLTIDGEKADVKVAGAQSILVKEADKKTHVAAAIPSGMAIDITWQRALPKVKAAPTKLYAETRTLVAVAEGILVCTETVDFNILHTAVKELKLAVPEGVSVLEVAGRNIHDWRVEKDGRLVIVPRGEVIGPYSLRISYEMPAADVAEVPVLRASGVEREKGFVGVIALANVEIKAGKVAGATVIDVKRLPSAIAAMTKQPILLGFRYISDKFSIPLTIKKHGEVSVLVTIIDSAMLTIMQLPDGRRMTRAIYTVRNNRNQFLRIRMPAGAEIWSAAVSGKTVTPAVDEKANVLIPLIRSAAGARELASFPVELVYVETPAETAPASGKMRVALPQLDTPAMHMMVNYYAPKEGRYGKGGGLFAAPKSGFTGTLHMVEEFTRMAADRGGRIVVRDAAKQARAMQQQFDVKMASEARAVGVTPIRVRLPIDGKLFKLEKILALPGDDLYFNVEYSDWKASK